MLRMSRSGADETAGTEPLDVVRLRHDFPALEQRVHGHPLVYLDNAATTLKPRSVIDAVAAAYASDSGNAHRSVHALSGRATQQLETARARVASLLNAGEPDEVVLTGGTTDALNLVASSWARTNLRPGDEVLITELEHHANLVPWQWTCEQTGARLRVVPVSDDGTVHADDAEARMGPRTRLVALAHVSNVLGCALPVAEITRRAHEHGALVAVDGAQAVAHRPVDVQALGCDFYAFSGHKLHGPTGTGALWARRELLEAMPPTRGGGGMVASVSFERTTFAAPPQRFEAGTPHVVGAHGLACAIEYVQALGWSALRAHERDLMVHAEAALASVDGLQVLGSPGTRNSVVSFVMDSIHPHDIGTLVDRHGVAIRTGHHCAQPLMKRLGIGACARASFALYNTRQDVDALAEALRHARERLS